MYRAALAHPHIAVDAAAGIPARIRLPGIIHLHRQYVLTFPDVWRQVVAERGVAVGPRTELMAVDPYGRVHKRTVEVNEQPLVATVLAGGESLGIISDTAGQCAASGSRWIVGTEISFYRPVVRQVKLTPVYRVERKPPPLVEVGAVCVSLSSRTPRREESGRNKTQNCSSDLHE